MCAGEPVPGNDARPEKTVQTGALLAVGDAMVQLQPQQAGVSTARADNSAEVQMVEVQMVDLTAELDSDDAMVDDDSDFEVTKVTPPQWTMNRTAPATPERPTKRVKMETPAHDGVASGRSVGEAVVCTSWRKITRTAFRRQRRYCQRRAPCSCSW